MNKIIASIKTFIIFLLPILGRVVLEVAADVINDVAYPDRKTRGGIRYSRMAEKSDSEGSR
jgi:hypothetical protein